MTRGAALAIFAAAWLGALPAAPGAAPSVAAAAARGPSGVPTPCPPAPHHAELVVEHGSGALVAVCVGFAAAQLTGTALVQQSGLENDLQQFGSYGQAVCQLDDEPTPVPANCFGPTTNWVLSVSRGCGPWQTSSVGVSSVALGDGDLEGFAYSANRQATPPGPAGDCPPVAPLVPPASAPTAASTTRAPPAPTRTPPSAAAGHPGGSPAASTAARSPAAGGPTSTATPPSPAGAALPSAAASGSPTGAVAALDTPDGASVGPSPTGVVAGPLRRSGTAPAPAASGRPPAWAWALAGLVAAGLVASLVLRSRRRAG